MDESILVKHSKRINKLVVGFSDTQQIQNHYSIEKVIDINSLKDLKNAAIYEGIEHRICEITADVPECDNLKLSGKFFYLRFRNGKITEKEFAKFAYDKIIRYCIPRKKFQEAVTLFSETGNERYITDLHDQAKNLFIKSIKEHGAQLGEPAELIAFIILEAFFNAPQIACKMFLKTSEKMPVHGSDSVHIKFCGKDDKLQLIWGESKLYQSMTSAMDFVVKSINSFLGKDNDNLGRPARERDIDIIKDMPDVDNDEMRKALCEYFNPYSEQSNKWKEIYSCFIGFDYELYKNLKGSTEKEIEGYFIENYIKKIQYAITTFSDKIEKTGLSNLEFILVLLPFEDVSNFRKEFFQLLGVSNTMINEDHNND